MFLRPSNDDEGSRARAAATAGRVRSLQAALSPSPCPEDARIRLELAGILAWQGHYRPVLDLLLPLLRPGFPWSLAMEARQMVADTHYRHDQYDLAHRQYLENAELAKERGDDYLVAIADCGRAWVLIDVGHFTTGEFDEAARIFEQHTPTHRRLGNHVDEAMGIYGLSRAAAGQGDYDRALRFAEEAIRVFEKHGREDFLQLPLLQIANVYRDQGSFDRARPCYEAAIDAADRNQDPYLQVLVANCYGQLLQFERETERARLLWMMGLAGAREFDFPRLGSEICERLAVIAADAKDFEEAYRRQAEGREFGNRVGVLSPVLKNQHMLLRAQIDRSAQLQEELSYLTAGIEASADGIFVLERPPRRESEDDFVVQFVNAAAARMLGRPPEATKHVRLRSVWKSSTANLLIEPSRDVYDSGRHLVLDPIQLEFTPGDPCWYSVKIAKISSGVAWSVSDVSDRVTMEKEIVAQRDRLEEANARLTALDREKSEVLGIAAHDLRSPIGNIRSLCELITPADPDGRMLLDTIEGIADSVLELIGNLLDVERIERGELQLRREPVSAGDLLLEVLSQFAADARQKAITLCPELSAGAAVGMPGRSLPPCVFADESALRRVIQNLLSNAIKFSPAGSRVVVRAYRTGTVARIEVQDSGPGITPSDRDRLFGKFARLSARPTAGESSTGLGLSIVKRLIDAMGGAVGCESAVGSGATFWIELDAP